MAASLGFLRVNLVAVALHLVAGHVYLFEPPTRNILARNAGTETCAHCLQAGGPNAVKARGGGLPVWPTMLKPESHGLCGDPVQNSPEPVSIQDERYMEPTSVQRTYTAGSTVEFRVGVSTHHWGHYEFRLCDWKLDKSLSSKQAGQDCLNEHVLHRATRSTSCGAETLGDCQYNNPNYPGRWYLPPPGSSHERDEQGNEVHIMKYVIPAGLTCEECTLQWYYATGNTCAYDEDYLSFDPGFKFWNHYQAGWTTKDNSVCGPNGNGNFGEEFWNCADVRVVVTPGSSPSTPSPTSVRTPIPTSAPITQEPQPKPEPEPEPEPESEPDPQPEPESEPEPEPELVPGQPCHQKECGCPDAQGQFPDATVEWCTLENAAKSGNEWCHASAEQCGHCSGGVYCTGDRTPEVEPEPEPSEPNSTQCSDAPTPWMTQNGKTCDMVKSVRDCIKCKNNANWRKKQFCRFSCYQAGCGYDGDVCAAGTTSTLVPTSAPTQPPISSTLVPTPAPTQAPTPSEIPSAVPACRIPACGCPPFTSGASWCKEDNSVMETDWCQESAGNCGNCGGGVWCDGSSLAQVVWNAEPAAAKINPHRFLSRVDHAMMQRAFAAASTEALFDATGDSPMQKGYVFHTQDEL